METYVDQTWGWDENFQKEYFHKHFDEKEVQIIEKDGAAIGAIETQDKDDKIFLLNLKIDPKFQDNGIGTELIRKMVNSSEKENKPVELQVLKVNPAQKLYERLGFEVIDETETHIVMRRNLV